MFHLTFFRARSETTDQPNKSLANFIIFPDFKDYENPFFRRGGVRTAATAAVLEQLDKWLAETKGSSIVEEFDMFAGTSFGASLVADMVYGDVSARTLARELGDGRFSAMMPPNSLERALGALQLRPLYDGIGKRAMLSRHIPYNTRLSDTDKHVVITGFDVDSRLPMSFCSWKSEPTASMLVRDAIDITTSTPGYFPIATTTSSGDRIRGIDGMMFATNPSDIAYTYALSLFGAQADIRVLSIGAGRGGQSYLPRSLLTDQSGGLQWVNQGELVETLFDCPQHITEFRMSRLTTALGHRYVRVNGYISNNKLDDTKPQNISSLKERGKTWWLCNKEQICKSIFDYDEADSQNRNEDDDDDDDDEDYEDDEDDSDDDD